MAYCCSISPSGRVAARDRLTGTSQVGWWQRLTPFTRLRATPPRGALGLPLAEAVVPPGIRGQASVRRYAQHCATPLSGVILA